ncbi:MAG: hypothetical protein CFK52_10695 [Chloracidobacterium sp. CP2_5A]|nr:MAG: hypothetical protein CFK52_10695 [Chloracidobacterium sp. CP2_5A]
MQWLADPERCRAHGRRAPEQKAVRDFLKRIDTRRGAVACRRATTRRTSQGVMIMTDTMKKVALLGLTAVMATGCFVGARNASEPRLGASPIALSRAAPAFLREAQALYEGSTDGLPKETPADEIAHYKAMLAELQTRNYAACSGCHQANGGGNKAINATNFQDAGWQRNNSSPGMVTSIVNGKGKVMPAYKDKLTLQQINYLVEYIRRFERAKSDAAPITAGIPRGAAPSDPPPATEEAVRR